MQTELSKINREIEEIIAEEKETNPEYQVNAQK